MEPDKDGLEIETEFDELGDMMYEVTAHGGKIRYPVWMSEASSIAIVKNIVRALKAKGHKLTWSVDE
jgi:hypothetical protein